MNTIKLTPIQNTIFTAIYEDKMEGEDIDFYEMTFCKASIFLEDDIDGLINNDLISAKDNRFYSTTKGKKLFDGLHQITTIPNRNLKEEQEQFLFDVVGNKIPVILKFPSLSLSSKIIKKLEKKGCIRKYYLIENEVITPNYRIYPTLRGKLYAEAYFS